jgi:hypothetical protein
MGEIRNAYKIFIGNLKGRDHLEDVGIGGKITLKWILGKQGENLWTGCIWNGTCTSGGLL